MGINNTQIKRSLWSLLASNSNE